MLALRVSALVLALVMLPLMVAAKLTPLRAKVLLPVVVKV